MNLFWNPNIIRANTYQQWRRCRTRTPISRRGRTPHSSGSKGHTLQRRKDEHASAANTSFAAVREAEEPHGGRQKNVLVIRERKDAVAGGPQTTNGGTIYW